MGLGKVSSFEKAGQGGLTEKVTEVGEGALKLRRGKHSRQRRSRYKSLRQEHAYGQEK